MGRINPKMPQCSFSVKSSISSKYSTYFLRKPLHLQMSNKLKQLISPNKRIIFVCNGTEILVNIRSTLSAHIQISATSVGLISVPLSTPLTGQCFTNIITDVQWNIFGRLLLETYIVPPRIYSVKARHVWRKFGNVD